MAREVWRVGKVLDLGAQNDHRTVRLVVNEGRGNWLGVRLDGRYQGDPIRLRKVSAERHG